MKYIFITLTLYIAYIIYVNITDYLSLKKEENK